MAGADGGHGSAPRDPAEARLLSRLRAVSIAAILVLVVFLVIVDTIGRLFLSPDFHIDDVVLTALVAALLTLLGFEGIARLTGGL